MIKQKEHLYVEIYNYLKEMIENKKYKEHDKLPSKRTLAQLLQVSPLTVDRSYQQLIMEGYVYSVEKSGYYVSKQIDLMIASHDKAIPFDSNPIVEDSYKHSFKTNIVDTSLFPSSTWAKLARQVLSEKSDALLNELPAKGMKDLRYELARLLEVYRGMTVDVEQIIIGSGTNSLISIIIELLGRNQVYGVENPSYRKMSQIYTSNDVHLIPVSLDSHGMNPLELIHSNVSIIHVTPSHQFPTGIVMPIQRRIELLNWASEHHRFIIEDDYESEFNFVGKPIPSLQSIDQNDCVIYMNTFTKTLAPSFRMSYMVLPKKLLTSYKKISAYQSCTVPNLEQYIMYKFMNGRYFERHLFRMKKLYKQKNNIIDEIFSTRKDIEVSGLGVGLHCLLVIKGHRNEQKLIQRLMANGVFIKGIHEYYSNNTQTFDSTLILGYSGISISELKNSLHILIQLIDLEK